jgi:hypothetical protein
MLLHPLKDCLNTLCQYAPASGLKACPPNSRLEDSGRTRVTRAAVIADMKNASEYFISLPWPFAAPEGGSSGPEEGGAVADPAGT